jgi:hypothetical protein
VLLIVALVLPGLAGSALADGRSVLVDADDGKIDECYSRAEFRDALAQARDDQRLYADAIGVIKQGRISNVTVPGRPCGSGRAVPRSAVAVSSSGAATLWGGAALLVAIGALGAAAIARRVGGGAR